MFQTVCIDWFKNKKLHIHTSTLGTPLPLSFSFSSLDSFWAVTFIVEDGSFPDRELTFRPCKDHLHLKRLLCFFFFACFRLKENIFIVTICNSVLHFTFYRAPDVFEMEISFFLSGFVFFSNALEWTVYWLTPSGFQVLHALLFSADTSRKFHLISCWKFHVYTWFSSNLIALREKVCVGSNVWLCSSCNMEPYYVEYTTAL